MPAAIACVMTDIVKSRTIQNCLRAKVGDKADRNYTEEIYNPCRKRFVDLLTKHSGKLHDDVGDQLAAYFDYAQDALQFAVALQRTMKAAPIAVPNDAGCPYLQLRAAIAFGTMETESYHRPGEYRVSSYSDLARVLAVARPEQILVTQDCFNRAGRVHGTKSHRWQEILLPKESEKVNLVEVLWDGRKPQKPEPPRQDDSSRKFLPIVKATQSLMQSLHLIDLCAKANPLNVPLSKLSDAALDQLSNQLSSKAGGSEISFGELLDAELTAHREIARTLLHLDQTLEEVGSSIEGIEMVVEQYIATCEKFSSGFSGFVRRESTAGIRFNIAPDLMARHRQEAIRFVTQVVERLTSLTLQDQSASEPGRTSG